MYHDQSVKESKSEQYKLIFSKELLVLWVADSNAHICLSLFLVPLVGLCRCIVAGFCQNVKKKQTWVWVIKM